MENPDVISEPSIMDLPKTQKKAKKASRGTSKGKNGVVISYLIVLIVFVLGVIICSVNGGDIDYYITMTFYQLGGTQALPGPWYKFGQFFDPSPLFAFAYGDPAADYARAWNNLYIGQIFGEAFIIIGLFFLFKSLAAYGNEKKKAKAENRPIIMPDSTKYYKYCWVLIIAGAFVALGLTQLIKGVTGRWRPFELVEVTTRIFTPWYTIAGNDADSFWSGHTSFATITTALSLFLLGSRKKKLAGVFAILSVVYVVCTGMARMIGGYHYFSDVLFGGFINYSIIVFSYFVLLDIPGQERIHRYQKTYTLFNAGYKLVLDGKAKLKESPDEGFKLISAGLEKFAAAKAAAVDINKYHREFDGFISRIDDLTTRFGSLINEYQSVAGKKEKIDAYLMKWSYVC